MSAGDDGPTFTICLHLHDHKLGVVSKCVIAGSELEKGMFTPEGRVNQALIFYLVGQALLPLTEDFQGKFVHLVDEARREGRIQ